MIDKTKNQVNVIYPYKTKDGVWCFDDEDVELKAEPFVGQINTMIDMYAEKRKKLTVYISHSPIHEQTLVLDKFIESNEEGIYILRGTTISGWLCPALLKYFKDYPEVIYVKIKK